MGDRYWIDLPNVINLQKNLVNSVDATSTSGQSAISAINTNLNSLAGNLTSASASIGPTLTYQNEVLNILNREDNRLNDRKTAIDAAYEGQKRMVNLTESAAAKRQAYNYILFVAVVALFLFVGLTALKKMELVPTIILDLAIIIISVLAIVYCIYLYTDIARRSNMDFNTIVLAEPVKKTPDQIAKDQEKASKSGDLLGIQTAANAGSCNGSNCCPAGTHFNSRYSICVPDTEPLAGQVYLANSDGTYGWSSACASGTNYIAESLKCEACPTDKPKYNSTLKACEACATGKRYDASSSSCVDAFTTLGQAGRSSSSANAQPYSASELNSYSRYV